MRSLSRNRLVRLMVPLAVLAMSAVVLYSYYAGNVNRTDKVIQSFLNHLAKTGADAISQQLLNLEEISFQFLANKDLNDALDGYSRQADRYQIAMANSVFANFLEGQAFINPEILNAVFWDYDDTAKKALTMRENLPNDYISSLKTSEFAARIRAAGGSPIWKQASITGEKVADVLFLGRMVRDTFSDEPLGFLVMSVDPSSLVETVRRLAEADLYYSIGTLRSEYLGIIDPRDKSVVARMRSTDSSKLVEVYDSVIGGYVQQKASGEAMFIKEGLGNEELLFIVAEIPHTSWQLVLPMSLRSSIGYLVSTDRQYVLNTVAGSLLALILSGLTAYFLLGPPSRRVSGETGGEASSAPGASGATAADGLLHDGCEGPAPCPSLADIVRRDKSGTLSKLTEKELKLLCLIVKGHSNKMIADLMCVAEQTVKNSCSTLYQKLGVEDRVQATVKAIKLGLSNIGDDNED